MTKFLFCIISGMVLIPNANAEAASYRNKIGTIKLESTIQPAPWEKEAEPRTLPRNWKKHRAQQNILVDYLGHIVTIPKGDIYFTYNGKVAIGWHGTYNPPRGMDS